MGIIISVSRNIDTGVTYACYFNKVYFVNLEEKKLPKNIKSIAKDLEISGFFIVKYPASSEIGCMLALWDQAYYVAGLPKNNCIISPQVLCTS